MQMWFGVFWMEGLLFLVSSLEFWKGKAQVTD